MTAHTLAFVLIGAPIGALLVHAYFSMNKGDSFMAGWQAILSLFLIVAVAILVFHP